MIHYTNVSLLFGQLTVTCYCLRGTIQFTRITSCIRYAFYPVEFVIFSTRSMAGHQKFSGGRQSPRLTEKTADTSELTNILKEMSQRIENLVVKNGEVLKRLDSNSHKIDELQIENSRLNKEVDLLNEKLNNQEQYSRKDVIIVTGMPYTDEESPHELAKNVAEMLNKITEGRLSLTPRDFIAIHRNGRQHVKNRPPTVTVKFIRFSDKDAVFEKRARKNFKTMFPKIHMHHGLCPGYIEIRNKLALVENVKFARYDGANRYFTVLVTSPDGGEDKFYNRIRNVEQLKVEMNS